MNVTFLARFWFQRNKNNNKVFITNRKIFFLHDYISLFSQIPDKKPKEQVSFC